VHINTSTKASNRVARYIGVVTCLISLSLVAVSAQTEAGSVYQKSSKAVVLIKTDKRSATGFLISANGLVATSYHVIEGVNRVSVRTSSGDVFDNVSLLAKDERRDLAILKIPGFDLPFVSLGNSNDINPGDKIIVIGNPLGTEQLQASVTDGIVSGLRDLGEGYNVIQMTAPVSPGNSGGPAFTAKGDAIGVVAFRLREGENLNFAVPINYVRGMLDTADPAKAIQQWTNSPDRASVTDGGSAISKWKTADGGQIATLRLDGDNIHIEAVSPGKAGKLYIKMNAELKNDAGKYTGTANSVITWTRTILVSSEKSAADRCTFTDPMEITSVTPSRIEGREFTAPTDAILDKTKCTFSKPKRWVNFIWVPE
jgi:hypothetical protein